METFLDRIESWGFTLVLSSDKAVAYQLNDLYLSVNFSSMFVVLEKQTDIKSTVVLYTTFLKQADYNEIVKQIERIISIQED